MEAEVYWLTKVEGLRLAIMPRPRAGDWLEDEISSWRHIGLKAIVSLLEDEEVRELGLERERELCLSAGLDFYSQPIRDRGVPEARSDIQPLVETLVQKLREGDAVGIHCRAGIGRSALLAGCVLRALGFEAEHAFDMLTAARGLAVPDTEAQRTWVEQFVI